MSKVTFNNSKSPFFDALRSRVDNYFKSQEAKPTGNIKLYFKTGVLLTTLVSLYLVIVIVNPPLWISNILFVLEGITIAAIGFNVMHDGAHGSYSSVKWVNDIMGHSLDFLGGSTFMWKAKHNIIHHTYTNVEGMDDDIAIPLMRINTEQEKKWYHKYQHIYAIFMYALLYIVWIFYTDFAKYFTGKVGDIKYRKMKPYEHVVFWVTKAISIFTLFVLPIMVLGWLKAVVGILIMTTSVGITISIVFQLAHIVEDISFPTPHPDTNKIESEWAVHQLNTTANFATKSKIVSWFVGGLNFQVEHHLFPKISHIHYPEINKIVKETCKEFNIRYQEFPSVMSAFRSHLSYLKNIAVA
ncbi:MAG: acyl-CoA desaturase [Bacteroidota bacterium]